MAGEAKAKADTEVRVLSPEELAARGSRPRRPLSRAPGTPTKAAGQKIAAEVVAQPKAGGRAAAATVTSAEAKADAERSVEELEAYGHHGAVVTRASRQLMPA